jgi:hypothetical protein
MCSVLAWIVVMLLAAVSGGGCGRWNACTDIGCGSGATLTVMVPSSHATLGSTVRVCRNDTCFSGTLSQAPVSTTAAESFSFPSASHLQGSVLAGEGGSRQVVVSWQVSDPAELHDGDRYRLEITDPEGIATTPYLDVAATYVRSSPSGPDCPTQCRKATISAEGARGG